MVEYLDPNKLEDAAADSVNDLGHQAELEGTLAELQQQLQRLPEAAPALERAGLMLEVARNLQLLERGDEAWPIGRAAFEIFAENHAWEAAADACDVLYQANQADSLVALGNGVWLGVTFPIDPEISVHLLSHIVDDTPDDADGAAVAAATAVLLADVRAEEGPDRERLVFFSNQLLGKVARRHSNVESNEQFQFWVEKLELDDPDKILVRLRNVVDVLAQDDWWIDRAALQDEITVN
ncbi:MAG: hypothetical protein ABFS23_11865 [Pseudomonadota bacterium]